MKGMYDIGAQGNMYVRNSKSEADPGSAKARKAGFFGALILFILSVISLFLPLMTYAGINVTDNLLKSLSLDAKIVKFQIAAICAVYTVIVWLLLTLSLGKDLKNGSFSCVKNVIVNIFILINSVIQVIIAFFCFQVAEDYVADKGIGSIGLLIIGIAGVVFVMVKAFLEKAVNRKRKKSGVSDKNKGDFPLRTVLFFVFVTVVAAFLFYVSLPRRSPFVYEECVKASKSVLVDYFPEYYGMEVTDTSVTFYSAEYKDLNNIYDLLDDYQSDSLGDMDADMEEDEFEDAFENAVEESDKIEEAKDKIKEKIKSLNYSKTTFRREKDPATNNYTVITAFVCDNNANDYENTEKTISSVNVESAAVKQNEDSVTVTYYAKYTDGSFIWETTTATAEKIVVSESDLPVTAVLYNEFGKCTIEVNEMEKSEYCGYIEGDTFYLTGEGEVPEGDYSAVTNVIIPDGVISVSDEIFREIKELNSLSIGKDVKNVAFDSNFDDTDFYLDISNYENGALIADGVLLAYDNPTDASGVVEIPQGVRVIATGALKNSEGMTKVVLPEGLEGISQSGFIYNELLKEIELPVSLEYVGKDAFKNVDTLQNVYISDYDAWFSIQYVNEYSNPMYYAGNLVLNGKTVERFYVPEDLTEVKDYVFAGIKGELDLSGATAVGTGIIKGSYLQEVNVPASLTTIADNAFAEAPLLENIFVNADNAVYASLDGVLTDKSGTELIFFPSGRIVGYIVPEQIKKIRRFAFSGTRLSELTINSTVKEVGDMLFENFIYYPRVFLEPAERPSGWDLDGINFVWDYKNNSGDYIWDENGIIYELEKQYGYAYVGVQSKKFTEVTVPETIEYEGTTYRVIFLEDAFAASTELRKMTLPVRPVYLDKDGYGDYKFKRLFSSYYFEGSVKVGEYYIPATLEELNVFSSTESTKAYSFSKMTTLKKVYIDTKGIYEGSFYGCTSLETVELSSRVTMIDHYAFENCSALTSITLGDNVAEIGAQVFKNCTSLKEIFIPEKTKMRGGYIFEGCSLTVKYEGESADTDGWIRQWKDRAEIVIEFNAVR